MFAELIAEIKRCRERPAPFVLRWDEAPRRLPMVTMADHVAELAPAVRAIVKAVRAAVKAAAPGATEVAYQSSPPRTKSAMWKLARYDVGEEQVAGIGVFAAYAVLFFYRGVELDDGSGLLTGGGKAMRSIRLDAPGDVARPAVKKILREAFRLART
jgi:hypothetical protein